MTGKTARQKQIDRNDAAIDAMIADPSLSYAVASARHGLKRENLKAAVHRKYGTIENARQGDNAKIKYENGLPVLAGTQDRWRNCMTCGTIVCLPKNIYRCSDCRKNDSKVHEGCV